MEPAGSLTMFCSESTFQGRGDHRQNYARGYLFLERDIESRSSNFTHTPLDEPVFNGVARGGGS
jgi:hypothetical protein